MKPDLMEILCCPVCRGDLTLKVTKEKEKEIDRRDPDLCEMRGRVPYRGRHSEPVTSG